MPHLNSEADLLLLEKELDNMEWKIRHEKVMRKIKDGLETHRKQIRKLTNPQEILYTRGLIAAYEKIRVYANKVHNDTQDLTFCD